MARYDREEVLAFHAGGKVSVRLPRPLKTKDDLCLAYTPGVAHAVKAIAENPSAVPSLPLHFSKSAVWANVHAGRVKKAP